MKIVHIEDFFHPDAGYQINVLAKYQANAGHEVIILTSEIDKIPDFLTIFFGKDNIEQKDREYESKYGVKIIRYPIYTYYSGRSMFHIGLKKYIDKLKPNMLYVHGDGTFACIRFIMAFGKTDYGIIFDSHMLKMASENPLSKMYENIFRMVFTPMIKRKKMVFIRTQDDDYLEKYLGIPLTQAPVVSHATDQLLFKPDSETRERVRRELGIQQDEFVVIYAGKLIESKGADLLAAAFQDTFDTSRKITLLVVGNTSGAFGESVEETFRHSKNRIIRVQTQPYSKLAGFYCAADLAVFPKQCSLSFYDVQACGLPVVEEDNNVNKDRLSHNNGLCFREGDVQDFRNKLLKVFNMPEDNFSQMGKSSIQYVNESFSYDKVYKLYEEVIENEWKRQMHSI